jgi:nucleotide-binding universal stress UspA family protein
VRLFGSKDEANIRRVLVATDRSETAAHAVAWAADLAEKFEAELYLCQVFVPPNDPPPDAEALLLGDAQKYAGERGRTVIAIGEDPSKAIVDAAEEQDVDVLVVGNVGMSGRKEFLLGNVPNRLSHLTRRTLVIVNTAQRVEGSGKRFGR